MIDDARCGYHVVGEEVRAASRPEGCADRVPAGRSAHNEPALGGNMLLTCIQHPRTLSGRSARETINGDSCQQTDGIGGCACSRPCTGATNPTTPPSPWWAFVQPPGATQTSAYHGAPGSRLTSVSAPAITATSAPAASWLATSRRRPDGTTRALACWPVGHPGVHRARLGPRDFRANSGSPT